MSVRRIGTGSLTLSVDVDEPEGPARSTVLLIHGFPDSRRLWRHQVPALRAAGFRTVAPDLRGFGESDRPASVAEYAVGASVADLVAVLDAVGADRVHVVGHDFGAVVAWLLATRHPERVGKLVEMSVGHPAAAGTPSIEQREKQWYTLLFQFEGIAEELLSRDDWALLRSWTAGAGDQENWLADLSRPGALTAGLNWYRANMHPRRQLTGPPPMPPIAADTLGLWSDGDAYLTEEQMVRSGEHVAGSWHYERVTGASHWLQLDRPEVVNRLLLGHLTGGSPTG